MSYNIYLEENEKVCKVEKHSEGGTYNVEGTDEARLNVTYNYSWFYFLLLDYEKGLRWLTNREADSCIRRLEETSEKLGTNQYKRRDDEGSYIEDYWAPTPGNAGYALNILLGWAKQHPCATFFVE